MTTKIIIIFESPWLSETRDPKINGAEVEAIVPKAEDIPKAIPLT